jgi:hypothetical protein
MTYFRPMTPAQAPLPLVGTWKLTSSATSHPELPHPESSVATFAQEEDGIHYLAETVWSDGRATKSQAVFQLDGNCYPISGSATSDSISLRRLDDRSLFVEMKKDGVVSGGNHTTVSPDGQTMTGHWEIVGPGGAVITWLTMSQRQ